MTKLKLMLFLLLSIFLANGYSSVVVSDNFQSGTVGANLGTGGWYAINATNIANIVYANSGITGFGKSAKMQTGYIQAKKDFTTTITDSDADLYAHFIITPGNQNMKFGVYGVTRVGFYLDVNPSAMAGGTVIKLAAGNNGAVVTSTDDYIITSYKTYEFVVQMTNINNGGKGSVKVRNMSTNETEYTDLEGLQNIPLNFLHTAGFTKPSNFASLYLRGGYNGSFDYIELGIGMAPIDTVALKSEDFETATTGNYIESEGWINVYDSGISNQWQVVNGANGTKSVSCIAAKPDAQWSKIFADPNELDYLEDRNNIYFEVDITPRKNAGTGDASTVRAGVMSVDTHGATRPTWYVGFATNTTDSKKWDIEFHNATTMPAGTPNMVWLNSDLTINTGNTYRFHVQVINNTTGSVFIKNLTLNEPCWTPVANMQNITMGFTALNKTKQLRKWWIRGSYATHQIDNFELGTGLMNSCDVYCDPALSGLNGDLTGDCIVNMNDLNIVAANWLEAAPVNLAVNGDFSAVDELTGLPVGWNYVSWGSDGNPTGQMYCQVEDGKIAQRMEKGIPVGYFGVYQVINVIPGRDYTINANWSGTTADKGWAELLVYCVNTPTPTVDDLYTLVEEGAIMAKHHGFPTDVDPKAVFATEPVTDAMYHAHCLVNPKGGTNVRTATTPYMVIRTNLGSIAPDSSGGIHEMYVDDITVTGDMQGDANSDDDANIYDFAVLADEWLTQAMGPY